MTKHSSQSSLFPQFFSKVTLSVDNGGQIDLGRKVIGVETWFHQWSRGCEAPKVIEKRAKSIRVREETRSGVTAVKEWVVWKGTEWIIVCIHDMVGREAANMCMDLQSTSSRECKRIRIEPNEDDSSRCLFSK